MNNKIQTIRLKATRIVVINTGPTVHFVCFQFDKPTREAMGNLQLGDPTRIELSDTNGEFINDKLYRIISWKVPNENGIGGAADVLILKADRYESR